METFWQCGIYADGRNKLTSFHDYCMLANIEDCAVHSLLVRVVIWHMQLPTGTSVILITDCFCDGACSGSFDYFATDDKPHFLVCLTSLCVQGCVSVKRGAVVKSVLFPSVYSFPLSQMVTGSGERDLVL